MRDTFVHTTSAILDDDPRTALVLAEISADAFLPAADAHPDRVINVGIREQLMLGVAGGLALTGMRPFVHTYAPFLVERAYEQIKLDLNHQNTGAVLVSVGASYDVSGGGRTHHAPADVALFDTLPDWTVRVPGHPDEVAPLLRDAAGTDDRVYVRLSEQRNQAPHHTGTDGRLVPVRPGPAGAPLVLAVGPMLDPVLAGTAGLPVTVAYTNTPRPLDAAGLRALTATAPGGVASIVLVEPYLVGTSTHVVAEIMQDRPYRLLSLGVGRRDLRRYGTPADHAAGHGLDPAGLRASISRWIGSAAA